MNDRPLGRNRIQTDKEEINGLHIKVNCDDSPVTVPRIVSQVYKYTSFSKIDGITIETQEGEKFEVNLKDAKTAIIKSFGDIWVKCANNKKCNDYFETLPGKQTLKQVIQGGPIGIHALIPRDDIRGKHEWSELPVANSDSEGRNIGIHPKLLHPSNATELRATFVHELAHLDGATTDKTNDPYLQAETALKHCGFEKQFDSEDKG